MMNEDDRKLLGVIAYLVASTAHIIAEESNISRTHKKRLADNVDDVLKMVEKYADNLTE